MMSIPLRQPCLHLATPEECRRDPGYRACTAQPGEPCSWALRYDGIPDPPFHSERIEACMGQEGSGTPLSHEALREAVLESGLF